MKVEALSSSLVIFHLKLWTRFIPARSTESRPMSLPPIFLFDTAEPNCHLLSVYRNPAGARLTAGNVLEKFTCNDEFGVEQLGVLLQSVVVDVASVGVHLQRAAELQNSSSSYAIIRIFRLFKCFKSHYISGGKK